MDGDIEPIVCIFAIWIWDAKKFVHDVTGYDEHVSYIAWAMRALESSQCYGMG